MPRLGYAIPTVLLAALLALLGYWLTHRETDPFQPRTDNTLRRHLGGDPGYLNPILRTSVDAGYVLGYVHHFLLKWDMEANEVRPDLAREWSISEDGLDYTFHLRTDVRWHDGERFDADDVLYSFKTCMDPEVPAGHARRDFLEFALTESLPADDGDGNLSAEEFLRLELASLPTLSAMPAMDGAVEPEAALLLSGTHTALGAARYGDGLYLWGRLAPRQDLTIFIARRPGEPEAYGPSTFVAQWDAFFLVDSGNLHPGPSGWYAGEKRRVESATFALGDGLAEAFVDLRALLDLSASDPLPEAVHIALAILDDVQVEKLDTFTVKFHFPRKNYANLENAGWLRLVAEHYYNTGEKFIDHPKRDVPLGVGPYKFVRWIPNSSIVVERWDDYWGERKPRIRRVEFKIINDWVVAYQVFRKGDIDVLSVGVWHYTQKSVGEAFDRHFFKVAYHRPGYGYMGYNTRRSFFSDFRVRQAMSHLIDTRAACESILMGLSVQVTGPFFYKEPAYVSELPAYEYSIEKAAALLDAAGWIDVDGDGIRDKDLNGDGSISHEPLDKDGEGNLREKFIFEYLISGSDAQNDWVMLSYLRNCPKVGIVCQARMVEYAIKLEWLREKKWDAGGGGWVVGIESDPYTFFHSSQAKDGFNFGAYNSPRADRAMEAARQELDKEKRTELFREVHRILWEEQPYTFLVGHNWRWVINKRVKNARLYELGFDFLEWELEGHEDAT